MLLTDGYRLWWWTLPLLLVIFILVILLSPEPPTLPHFEHTRSQRPDVEVKELEGVAAVSGPVALLQDLRTYKVGERVLHVGEGLAPKTSEKLWVLPLEREVRVYLDGEYHSTLDIAHHEPLCVEVDGLSVYVAYVDTSFEGFVVRYDLIDNMWVEYQTLRRMTPLSGDFFGRAISVRSKYMAVTDALTVTLYYRESEASDWLRAKSIYPSTDTILFGSAVLLTENACYVSSPYETVESCTHAGVVYVHLRTHGSWGPPVRVHSPNIMTRGRFGTKVVEDQGAVWILDAHGAHCYNGFRLIQSFPSLQRTHPLCLDVGDRVLFGVVR